MHLLQTKIIQSQYSLVVDPRELEGSEIRRNFPGAAECWISEAEGRVGWSPTLTVISLKLFNSSLSSCLMFAPFESRHGFHGGVRFYWGTFPFFRARSLLQPQRWVSPWMSQFCCSAGKDSWTNTPSLPREPGLHLPVPGLIWGLKGTG